MSATARAAGLLLGWAADVLLGDPRRHHPVAAFGSAAAALERRAYGESRPRGAGYAAVCVAGVVGPSLLASRAAERSAVATTALTAAATWTVLGGTSLGREAAALCDALERGDVPAARARIPSLCARDPQHLDEPALARAAVESVAENTSDAVVAPLLWGALAGPAGLLGYRAVNTLDAMVGYRSPRYARFGWASARLDDAVNLVPARVTAALVVLVAPFVGADAGRALRTWLRDGAAHPSPNAGRCEAAVAGALGVRLGGAGVYGGALECRLTLGDGRPPEPGDVRRAVRLSRAVGLAAALLASAVAGLPLVVGAVPAHRWRLASRQRPTRLMGGRR